MINPAVCKQSERGTVIIPCISCHKPVDTGVSQEEANRYFHGDGHIQKVMPNVPAEMREMFISGTCGECWDRMFADDEEEDDWDDDYEPEIG